MKISPAHLGRVLAEANLSLPAHPHLEGQPRPRLRGEGRTDPGAQTRVSRGRRGDRFDQMGPVSLRPTAGAGWAPKGRPERQRADYNRRHGTRYVFGAYDVHADRLRVRLRAKRRGMRHARVHGPDPRLLPGPPTDLLDPGQPLRQLDPRHPHASPRTTASSSSRPRPTPATSTPSNATSRRSASSSSPTPTTSTGTPSPSRSPATHLPQRRTPRPTPRRRRNPPPHRRDRRSPELGRGAWLARLPVPERVSRPAEADPAATRRAPRLRGRPPRGWRGAGRSRACRSRAARSGRRRRRRRAPGCAARRGSRRSARRSASGAAPSGGRARSRRTAR